VITGRIHVVINALGLRFGGGLQVIGGLVSRLSADREYTFLCSDQDSKLRFEAIIGNRKNVRYVDPVGSSSAAKGFLWSMTRQSAWLRRSNADAVLGVNHHYPSGDIPQIIYHLNVSRFERPEVSIFSSGELAERLRDWRTYVSLKFASANLFESNYLLEKARKRYGDPKSGQVVYIGVDDSNPDPSRTAIETYEGQGEILALTSYLPNKDNPTLIRMLDTLLAERPEIPWRLLVAGGLDEKTCASLLADASHPLTAVRTEFLGFCSHDELAEMGRKALCLVSTSLVESFSMVAIEAMGWGCPVVVANCSSMPESIADAGLLAVPSDAVDFAAQVQRLHDDPELRRKLIEKGFQRIADLGWSQAAAQVDSVLKHLIRELPEERRS